MAELARSESIYGSYGKYYIVGIDYIINSQSSVTNSTNLTKILWLEGLQYASASWSSGSATIDGNTLALNVFSIGPYQRIVLKQETVDIKHDQEGRKTITISGSYTTAPGLHGVVSGTLTLPVISLGSKVACPDIDVGSATTIGIQSFVANAVHTISYSFKGLTGVIVDKTNQNPIVWQIPELFYEKMPDSKREECVLICATYVNDKQIGIDTSYKFHVMVNEEDNKPEFTVQMMDTNEKIITLTGSNQKLIKYFSCPQIVINATPKNYATIKNYRIDCSDGKSGREQDSIISNVESGDFKVTVTDSRDISTVRECNMVMVDYIKLGIKKCSFERENPASNSVILNVNGVWFNDSFSEDINNELIVKWRYKETYGSWSDYNLITPVINDNDFSIINLNLDSETLNFDYRKNYQFELLVLDKIYDGSSEELSITASGTVLKGVPTYDVGEHDLNVNGVLTVSDEEGNNPQAVVVDNDLRLVRGIADFWISHGAKMTWTSNWSNQIVPFSRLGQQIGDKFTYSNYGCKVGKGVSWIKVFINFNWYNIELDSDTAVMVMKNGNPIRDIAYINANKNNSSYIQAVGMVIFDVVEGDIITVGVNKGSAGTCSIFGQTRMVVEAIG